MYELSRFTEEEKMGLTKRKLKKREERRLKKVNGKENSKKRSKSKKGRRCISDVDAWKKMRIRTKEDVDKE